MGLLACALSLSGLTHGRPPVPFTRVQQMWYPWYQISSAAPHVLGKRALILVNQFFLFVVKLPSAASDLE
jgi:hypothetical protein